MTTNGDSRGELLTDDAAFEGKLEPGVPPTGAVPVVVLAGLVLVVAIGLRVPRLGETLW